MLHCIDWMLRHTEMPACSWAVLLSEENPGGLLSAEVEEGGGACMLSRPTRVCRVSSTRGTHTKKLGGNRVRSSLKCLMVLYTCGIRPRKIAQVLVVEAVGMQRYSTCATGAPWILRN